MKKILICINLLDVGGASTSLLNLANSIKDDCDLTLLFFNKHGSIMNKIPDGVNVIIPKGYMSTFISVRKLLKKLPFKLFLFKAIMGLFLKIFKTNKPFLKFALKHSEKLEGYDYAISFSKIRNNRDAWTGVAEYVLNNVDAKNKFIVTHDDYIKEDYTEYAIETYKKFDKIFAVSKSVCDNIENNVPELKGCFDYFYNIVNVEEILSKKDDLINCFNKGFNIVFVGRLSKEKGLMRLLKVCKKLLDEGFIFFLNIVGDGADKDLIENFILDNNLKENIILHGCKSNPYPYFKQADLTILASYYESFGLVLIESMLIGTPVLTTEITSSREIVGDWGYVCKNSEEDLYNSLKYLLENKSEIIVKKENLKDYKYDNDKIIKKLHDLFKL